MWGLKDLSGAQAPLQEQETSERLSLTVGEKIIYVPNFYLSMSVGLSGYFSLIALWNYLDYIQSYTSTNEQ